MTSLFAVYVLELGDGSYDVGHTDDIQRRILEHRKGIACAHTAKIRMKSLLWSEAQKDRLSAGAREQEIKGWRREKKEMLWQARDSRLP